MPDPIDLLQRAASNNWLSIAPEVALGLLALLLLVFEIVLPKKNHGVIPALAILGQLAILAVFVVNYTNPAIATASLAFNGLIEQSAQGQFMRLFFLLTSLLVSILGTVSLARQGRTGLPRIEFFAITLVISGALMLLAQAHNFILLFVALETVTVGFYILVSYFRQNPLSLEAGLKYLITGSLSSGLLLFGIVLLYGVAGSPDLPGTLPGGEPMDFTALRLFLAANPGNFLAGVGIVLVLCGVAFKIGAVPFQIWIPDVYQGAPTPVTAFLAVGSKAAGFTLLLILTRVFGTYSDLLYKVLVIMAVATILFGNLAALTQHNVKRLLGLSGVSHAGYLLIGVIASLNADIATQAVGAINFYLLAYLLASFAVFGVMTHVAGTDDATQELEDYNDLGKTHPFLAGVLAIGLGSMAGIPPLAGFMGKLFVFLAAFRAELYLLLAVAIIGVVISIYYYFGWIKAAYFNIWRAPLLEGETDPRPPRAPVGALAGVTLAILAAASVVLGIWQGPLGAWLILR
ncbi:MAG: NADH-quinone oxidoreductase subunit N [Opitutaceae bacterium]|jgi:NADH-quinone oxidoreductase subunit N|nr:NADH-quinone oxidoreductase subunit N [Opitutaceae bacterium]